MPNSKDVLEGIADLDPETPKSKKGKKSKSKRFKNAKSGNISLEKNSKSVEYPPYVNAYGSIPAPVRRNPEGLRTPQIHARLHANFLRTEVLQLSSNDSTAKAIGIYRRGKCSYSGIQGLSGRHTPSPGHDGQATAFGV